MARNQDKDRNPVITLRLNDAENLRFWNVMDIAKSRNSYANKSDVLREIIGIEKLKVLTKQDVDYFKYGKTAKNLVFASDEGNVNENDIKNRDELKDAA